jgi:hypothetical protein
MATPRFLVLLHQLLDAAFVRRPKKARPLRIRKQIEIAKRVREFVPCGAKDTGGIKVFAAGIEGDLQEPIEVLPVDFFTAGEMNPTRDPDGNVGR